MFKALNEIYDTTKNPDESQEILRNMVDGISRYIQEKYNIREITFDDEIPLRERYSKLYSLENALESIAFVYDVPVTAVGLNKLDSETNKPTSLALYFKNTSKQDSTGMFVGGFYKPYDHSITLLTDGILFHEWTHAMRYTTGLHYDSDKDGTIWSYHEYNLTDPAERASFVNTYLNYYSAKFYFEANNYLQNRFENSLSNLSDEQKQQIESKVHDSLESLLSFFKEQKYSIDGVDKYIKAFDSKSLSSFTAHRIFKSKWKSVLEAYKTLHEYIPGFRLDRLKDECSGLIRNNDINVESYASHSPQQAEHFKGLSEFSLNNDIRDLFEHKGINYFGTYEEMAAYGASAAFDKELGKCKILGIRSLLYYDEVSSEAFKPNNINIKVLGKQFILNEKPQDKGDILKLKTALKDGLHQSLQKAYSLQPGEDVSYTPLDERDEARILFNNSLVFSRLKNGFGVNDIYYDVSFAQTRNVVLETNVTFSNAAHCIIENMGLPKDILSNIGGKPVNLSFVNDCYSYVFTESRASTVRPDMFFDSINNTMVIKASKLKQGNLGEVFGQALAQNIPEEQKASLVQAIKYEIVSGSEFADKAQSSIKMFYDSSMNVLDAFCKENASELAPEFRDTIVRDIQDIFATMYEEQTLGSDFMKFIDIDIAEDKTRDIGPILTQDGFNAQQIKLLQDIQKLCVYPSIGNSMANIIVRYVNNAAEALTNYNQAVNGGKNSGKVFSGLYLDALKKDYDTIDIDIASSGDAIVSYESRLQEFEYSVRDNKLIGAAIGGVIAENVKNVDHENIKDTIGCKDIKVSSNVYNTIMSTLSETYSRESDYGLGQDDIDENLE